MPAIDQQSMGVELRAQSYYTTSFEELGMAYDADLAAEIVAIAPEGSVQGYEEEMYTRERRATSPACIEAAERFIEPVVDHIFSGDRYNLIRGKWALFGVNYYEEGAIFPSHYDLAPNSYEAMTVIIASLSGARLLKVEHHPPIKLVPGSLTLLDGLSNPQHSALCYEGPSVSVVADVPATLF